MRKVLSSEFYLKKLDSKIEYTGMLDCGHILLLKENDKEVQAFKEKYGNLLEKMMEDPLIDSLTITCKSPSNNCECFKRLHIPPQ